MAAGKLKRKRIDKRVAADRDLLFHAMYVMAAVDGDVAPEELTVLRALLASLPDFREADLDRLVDASRALARRHGGILESIAAFGEMSDSTDLRYRALVLAVEVAYASGTVNAAEDQLLSSMGHLLGLNDDVCEGIINVMSFKYAT